MTTYFAETALLPDGWADNVLIEVDKDGWILGVESFKKIDLENPDAEIINAPVIPGIPNAHSHTFQRAMAGLAERATGKKDSFWSWRDTMYRFLQQIGPEEMEVIAAQTFVDMMKAGYTSVAEFHYVHHQTDGTPYDRRAELSHHVIKAAVEAGMSITHLPVLYAYGGFGPQAPSDGQKRFLNGVPEILEIVNDLTKTYKGHPQVTIGYAHHSLRAVSPDMLHEATKAVQDINADIPVHIHVAEQTGEVEACQDWSGKRPVERLLDQGLVNDKWTVIHATHMTGEETEQLAASGVTVGLCPTTEANLGDGIFPLLHYFTHGGRFAIGSDSHVCLNPFEEMRWLEYMQRLIYKERTILKQPDLPSVGGVLLDNVLAGGAAALGRKVGKIEAGYRADFVVLDKDLPVMTGKLRDHIIDTAVFAARVPVMDVMVGGHWVVKNGHHKREAEILRKYKAVIEKLI